MTDTNSLKKQIVQALEEAGQASLYQADANEPDPRYRAYGVRMPQKKAIFKQHRPAIKALPSADQIALGKALIHSGFGEQQTIGIWILEPHIAYFTPDRFTELDQLARSFMGWSKVDEFAVSNFKNILFDYPQPFMELIRTWNRDPEPWPRRLSVVLFTRKIAQSNQFTDFALEMCDNLKHAPEPLVQKGVGWALKDMMRVDKSRILAYVKQLRQQNVPKTITTYAIRDLKGQERNDFLGMVQK